ncbi:MAG: AI-2E family transporter [Oscillospiraceae bacterium]|nr:AI-2E family transporter [Oscillospiraceae bacterium]
MTDKDKKRKNRMPFFLVTYGILLYMALQNFTSVKNVLLWIIAILEPVAYGICIAFIINLFMNIFRYRVFHAMGNSKRKWEQKLCPVLSGICTALVFLIIVTMIIFIIIPQIYSAINTLIEKMPSSQKQLMALIESKLTQYHAPEFVIKKVHNYDLDWNTALKWLTDLMDGNVKTVLGTAFNATASVLSTATNLILGLIIAIYLLVQKRRVIYVWHKILELFVPKQYLPQTRRILTLTKTSFSNFLTGQFIEATLLGTLTGIGMAIFRIPYAATVGIIIGITALLPIIGAWIGGGLGALLVWVESPEKAIWFIVFIFVLQQFDNQLIYPKVVGDTIGLPGLLVLIAVIVGGGLGGVIGIIVAVPIFAIAYSLLKDAIDRLPAEEDAEPQTDPPAPLPAAEDAGAAEAVIEETVTETVVTVTRKTEPAAPAPQKRKRSRKKR